MKRLYTLLLVIIAGGVSLMTLSCDQLSSLSEHEVVFEDDLYLKGTTSDEGYVNLNDYAFWCDHKDRIDEVTEVIIQYQVTHNNSPTDTTASFYFGEYAPNVYLGSAFLAAGATTSGLVMLSLMPSQDALIDLILQKDAFWYSVQGNSETADVSFEPVRVTIRGTFDIP